MKNLRRILRHLAAMDWQRRRAFPKATLCAIEAEIRTSEAGHDGEIRFAVESALSGAPLFHGQTARERALDVFSQMRIWDTEHRNGVLIYLLLADHAVEIIADRGLHARTGSAEWERICRAMEAAFGQGRYEQGAIEGLRAVTQTLTRHFPGAGPRQNELPDKVLLL